MENQSNKQTENKQTTNINDMQNADITIQEEQRNKKNLLVAVIILIATFSIIAILLSLFKGCEDGQFSTDDTVVTTTITVETTTPLLDFTPAEEKSSKSITIPAVTGFNMIAGQTHQRVVFENPATNKCLFKIKLYLSDNTLIWESKDYIKPNEKIVEEELTTTLKRGVYKNCILQYDCYSLNGLQKLNGSIIKVMISAV